MPFLNPLAWIKREILVSIYLDSRRRIGYIEIIQYRSANAIINLESIYLVAGIKEGCNCTFGCSADPIIIGNVPDTALISGWWTTSHCKFHCCTSTGHDSDHALEGINSSAICFARKM